MLNLDNWTVNTIYGYAGGLDRAGMAKLEVKTDADAVSEIWKAVDGVPDMLWVIRNLVRSIRLAEETRAVPFPSHEDLMAMEVAQEYLRRTLGEAEQVYSNITGKDVSS